MKYHDEIGLVDVFLLIAKRWKWAVFSFFLPILCVLLFLFFRPEIFAYQSLYKIPEESPGKALESIDSVVEKAKRIYHPQAKSNLIDKGLIGKGDTPVSIVSPDNTLLIAILSESTLDEEDKVNAYHESILLGIKGDQQESFDELKKRIEQQLEAARDNYKEIKSGESKHAAELATRYIDQVSKYEDRLLAMQEGKVVMKGSVSVDSVNISGLLLMLMGIAIGMILSVTVPLLMEGVLRMKTMINRNRT